MVRINDARFLGVENRTSTHNYSEVALKENIKLDAAALSLNERKTDLPTSSSSESLSNQNRSTSIKARFYIYNLH